MALPGTAAVRDEVDGRRARRTRNRDAVVDALLDLLGEGVLDPGIADVAARSGVSYRSVFRYFDDTEDLYRAASQRHQARVAPLLAVPGPGEGSLPERVGRLVEARVRLFEAVAPIARAARLRAPFEPFFERDLARSRAFFRRQVQRHFAPELEALPPAEAAAVLAAADVLCSFESHDLLRGDQRLSRAATARVLRAALLALLGDRR